MMTGMNKAGGLSALALFLGLGLVTGKAEEKPANISVKQIEDAWKARESAFPSAMVKWQETYHLPKGSMSGLWFRGMEKNEYEKANPGGKPVPESDRTFVVHGTMQLNGSSMFLERDQPNWVPSRQQFEQPPIRCLFDGQDFRRFMPSGLGDIRHSSGQIRAVKVCVDASEPWCRPLSQALRPDSPAFRAISLSDLVVTGRSIGINGVHCLETEIVPGGMVTNRRTHWLAPSQGYAVVRTTTRMRGRICLQIDTKHTERRPGLWMPESWRVSANILGDGITYSLSGKVVEWVNEAARPKKMVFPPGTMVSDPSRPQGEQYYLVTPDKKAFAVNGKRVRLPYPDLVSAMNDDYRTRSAWRGTTSVVLVVANLMLAVLAYRRIRVRRAVARLG